MGVKKWSSGLAGAALVVSTLVAATAGPTMAAETRDGASARCEPGDAGFTHARIPYGVSLGKDPNTLTRAEAAQTESRSARLLANRGIVTARRADGSVTVPTHVHVLVRDNGSGDVADRRIQRQIAVLNEAFSGSTHEDAADTPFRLRLDSLERTPNTDWYNMDAEDSGQARRALRIGDARHLNLYVANFTGNLEGVLGFATLPERYSTAPLLDGAVLWSRTLPGGDAIFENENGITFDYAQGDTATHEIGHWLNLYHTFQGSCGPINDYVTDTPRQRAGKNVLFCRLHQNTCGNANSAPDPVQNFMGYADDQCMNRFTWGQRDRMSVAWYIREALSG